MAKSSGRKVEKLTTRIKTAVTLSPESFRRLGAACVAENLSQSAVIELLISRSLGGYFIGNRGDRLIPGASIDRRDIADSVSESATIAA